jgi:hypothetical protein
MCFIVPPPADRLHSSWRAIVYVKSQPEKTFHGTRNLPTELEPDLEIMKQELCDPDHIPAHVVQISEKEQFVYIEGDVCEVIGTEIHMADGHNDPYLRKGKASKPSVAPKPSLIIPGQQNQAAAGLTRPTLVTTSQQAAAMGAGGPMDLADRWIVDLTFKTHPVSDPELANKVKMVAWNHGLNL